MDSAEIDAFWVLGHAKKHQKTGNVPNLMLFGWPGKRRSIKTTRIHGN